MKLAILYHVLDDSDDVLRRLVRAIKRGRDMRHGFFWGARTNGGSRATQTALLRPYGIVVGACRLLEVVQGKTELLASFEVIYEAFVRFLALFSGQSGELNTNQAHSASH